MLADYKITLRKYGFDTAYQQLKKKWKSVNETIFWDTVTPVIKDEETFGDNVLTYEDRACFCGYSEVWNYCEEARVPVKAQILVEDSMGITSQQVGRLW